MVFFWIFFHRNHENLYFNYKILISRCDLLESTGIFTDLQYLLQVLKRFYEVHLFDYCWFANSPFGCIQASGAQLTVLMGGLLIGQVYGSI